MIVTDKQVAVLRAALVGDDETFERLGGESDQDYGDAFGVLMATAFVLAARRRFPGDWSSADVIPSSARSARDMTIRTTLSTREPLSTCFWLPCAIRPCPQASTRRPKPTRSSPC